MLTVTSRDKAFVKDAGILLAIIGATFALVILLTRPSPPPHWLTFVANGVADVVMFYAGLFLLRLLFKGFRMSWAGVGIVLTAITVAVMRHFMHSHHRARRLEGIGG